MGGTDLFIYRSIHTDIISYVYLYIDTQIFNTRVDTLLSMSHAWPSQGLSDPPISHRSVSFDDEMLARMMNGKDDDSPRARSGRLSGRASYTHLAHIPVPCSHAPSAHSCALLTRT